MSNLPQVIANSVLSTMEEYNEQWPALQRQNAMPYGSHASVVFQTGQIPRHAASNSAGTTERADTQSGRIPVIHSGMQPLVNSSMFQGHAQLDTSMPPPGMRVELNSAISSTPLVSNLPVNNYSSEGKVSPSKFQYSSKSNSNWLSKLSKVATGLEYRCPFPPPTNYPKLEHRNLS